MIYVERDAYYNDRPSLQLRKIRIMQREKESFAALILSTPSPANEKRADCLIERASESLRFHCRFLPIVFLRAIVSRAPSLPLLGHHPLSSGAGSLVTNPVNGN